MNPKHIPLLPITVLSLTLMISTPHHTQGQEPEILLPGKVIATATTQSPEPTETYKVKLIQQGESAMIQVTKQENSPEAPEELVGNTEDVDPFLLKNTPEEVAPNLIFQLAKSEVETQGTAGITRGLQKLVEMFGPSAYNQISRQRLEAYAELGVDIPNPADLPNPFKPAGPTTPTTPAPQGREELKKWAQEFLAEYETNAEKSQAVQEYQASHGTADPKTRVLQQTLVEVLHSSSLSTPEP
jgi:hypothetical protein